MSQIAVTRLLPSTLRCLSHSTRLGAASASATANAGDDVCAPSDERARLSRAPSIVALRSGGGDGSSFGGGGGVMARGGPQKKPRHDATPLVDGSDGFGSVRGGGGTGDAGATPHGGALIRSDSRSMFATSASASRRRAYGVSCASSSFRVSAASALSASWSSTPSLVVTRGSGAFHG